MFAGISQTVTLPYWPSDGGMMTIWQHASTIRDDEDKIQEKKIFWKGKLAIKVHSKRDKKDKNYMQGKSIKLILINYLQNTNQSLTKIKKKKKNVYYDSL